MFSFNYKLWFGKKKEEDMFKIVQGDQNKFFIVNRHGIAAEGTSAYGRKRDAIRGATRRGLPLAA